MSAIALFAAGRSSLGLLGASSGSAAMLMAARAALASPALHQASSASPASGRNWFHSSSQVAAADPKQQKIVMPTAGVPAGINQTFASGHVAPHPGYRPEQLPSAVTEGKDDAQLKEAFMEHPHYDWKYLESVGPVHVPPKDAADRVGMTAVRIMRSTFDWITAYGHDNMTERKWLVRFIFLETVAGVPGMVAGMLRHLHSLRLMRRDKGWIHQLLEEAENERMHLLTFLELGKPGLLFRAAVLATQGIFFNGYFLAYLLWPKACHSFVGYLEEEAVKTYTQALAEMEPGRSLAHWREAPCPPIAQTYWGLPKEARMRELILAIRADEACHSHVNHTLKTLKPSDANPFAMSGKSQLP